MESRYIYVRYASLTTHVMQHYEQYADTLCYVYIIEAGRFTPPYLLLLTYCLSSCLCYDVYMLLIINYAREYIQITLCNV